jgi:hypothetical protein
MNKRLPWLVLLALIAVFALAACGGPEEIAPPTETPMPSTPLPPSATPAPTDLPSPTPLSVDSPQQPTAYIDENVNLRAKPSTESEIVGSAVAGDSFPIIGVDGTGEWWQIEADGQVAWVYASFVRAENTAAVAVVEAATTAAGAVVSPEATPIPSVDAGVAAELAPAPAPVGTVVVYEESVTLPTYPVENYQTPAVNETYNWPYQRFDWERFRAESPAPEDRVYRLIVLENAFLKVTILPELGGRIWQVIHKASGENSFYQNAVVKPSAWGPFEQRGWTAIGGLEWNLPVNEHGYAWGEEWGYLPLQQSDDLASVTVFTPRDGRTLNGSVTISLRSGAASFEIEPSVSNLSDSEQSFVYWLSAALAPGAGNSPSAQTAFIFPGNEMTVHSTEDSRLPAPGEAFAWPVHNGIDYSLLGNWTNYLGFFERPAAQGPFAAVYDHAADAGVVRIFPAQVARGSKLFSLGWQSPLPSDLYTDDGSAYVELHGGLMPTFDETFSLPPGGTVNWREVWYPVRQIGGVTWADEVVTLSVQPADTGLEIAFYPTRPLGGLVRVFANGQEILRQEIEAKPDAPASVTVAQDMLPTAGPLDIRLEDGEGRSYFRYTYSGPLR